MLRFLHCTQGRIYLPDSILQNIWSYDLYTDPLSVRIIVVRSDCGTPCPERVVNLTPALSALPVEGTNLKIELLADTGDLIIVRPHGVLKPTLKFDETIFYHI